jgi:hypothetical protein
VTQLLRDGPLLERAREEALRYAREQPFESWPATVKALFEAGAWDRRFGLSRVG